MPTKKFWSVESNRNAIDGRPKQRLSLEGVSGMVYRPFEG
jgi:hypothetical protein